MKVDVGHKDDQPEANMSEEVQFPVSVTFEDGTKEQYADAADLEMNLEDFDSASSPDCHVLDASGREVHLEVRLLSLKRLTLKGKS